MARSVRDCARLLECIAGADGIDDRQPLDLPAVSYTQLLSAMPSDKPLSGMTLGVLNEGFNVPGIAPSISNLCHRAIDVFERLGATITPISIPLHKDAAVTWMCALPLPGAPTALLNDSMGRKQLHLTDRETLSQLTQEQFDALGPGAQNLYMRYLFMKHTYGAKLHGKCTNLLRKINVPLPNPHPLSSSFADMTGRLHPRPNNLHRPPDAHPPLSALETLLRPLLPRTAGTSLEEPQFSS